MSFVFLCLDCKDRHITRCVRGTYVLFLRVSVDKDVYMYVRDIYVCTILVAKIGTLLLVTCILARILAERQPFLQSVGVYRYCRGMYF